jgi:hypothetical protein
VVADLSLPKARRTISMPNDEQDKAGKTMPGPPLLGGRKDRFSVVENRWVGEGGQERCRVALKDV